MDFIPFTVVDFIDIFLVASIVYGLYRMSRGTNAPYILTGIVAIYVLWVLVKAFNMELLQAILGQVINVGVIAIIILFQPELRHFLQMIGRRQGGFSFLSKIFNSRADKEPTLQPIITACSEMSATKTGALIVLAQRSDLSDIIDGGITVDARVSVALLENIFFKNAPLHDGAAIIQNDRVVAAKCILPVTQSPVPKSYGTRHRAAIGITETSDAIVVVVSEETGGISVAFGGKIERNIAPRNLMDAISKHFVDNPNAKVKERGWERSWERRRRNRNKDNKENKENKVSTEGKDNKENKEK